MSDPIEAMVLYFAFVFSATCHEASHAWAAKRGGDLTAYAAGQVSLDPTPHIRREPFGMVILPLLGLIFIGWPLGFASAPYDPSWALNHPRRAGWMSLAGPAANLVLLSIFGLAIHLATLQGVFQAPLSASFSQVTVGTDDLSSALALVLGVFFSMNLLLFVLNMLPVPPLDGSGVLLLLIPRSSATAYQMWMRQPMVSWIGIILVFRYVGEIFAPIFFTCVGWLYPGVSYGP
jgi:Zn-dependent protease